MNGATTVPLKMMSAPINNNTAMIGVSHHFLLCFRKSMNSAISPG